MTSFNDKAQLSAEAYDLLYNTAGRFSCFAGMDLVTLQYARARSASPIVYNPRTFSERATGYPRWTADGAQPPMPPINHRVVEIPTGIDGLPNLKCHMYSHVDAVNQPVVIGLNITAFAIQSYSPGTEGWYADYADKYKCTVIAPIINLAPEHVYPRSINDIITIVEYLDAYSESLNINMNKLSFLSSESGCAIALGVAAKCRDTNTVQPKAIIMTNPILDCTLSTPEILVENYPMLNKDELQRYWGWYLGENGFDESDDFFKYASPLHLDTLKGMPDLYIIYASADLCVGETRQFVQAASEAGIPIISKEQDGEVRSFYSMFPESACGVDHATFMDNAFTRILS